MFPRIPYSSPKNRTRSKHIFSPSIEEKVTLLLSIDSEFLVCYTYTNHPIENSFEKMPTSFHSNRWLALERYRLNFSLIAPCALSSGTSSTPNIFSRSCRSIVYSILERVDARMPRLGIFEQALHLRKSFLWTDKVVNRLRMFAHFLLTRWNVSFVRHGWIGLFLSE